MVYAAFGVETDPLMWIRPHNLAALAATIGGPVPIRPHLADVTLNAKPADFLVHEGTIAKLKYGRFADDAWSIDEALAAIDELGLRSRVGGRPSDR